MDFQPLEMVASLTLISPLPRHGVETRLSDSRTRNYCIYCVLRSQNDAECIAEVWLTWGFGEEGAVKGKMKRQVVLLSACSTIPLWVVKIGPVQPDLQPWGFPRRPDRGYDARDRRVEPEPRAGFLGTSFCVRRPGLASVAVF